MSTCFLPDLKTLSAMALLGLSLSCGRKTQTVDPVAPSPEPAPLNEPVQKSEIDVKLLRITSYFNRFLNGPTTYVSEVTPEAWLNRPVQTPDYGRMLAKGTAIRMIAVGGGMTAGAQNGGLYREGQLTAYPNLVARQVGMADFTTPAFDQQHENGTGFDLRAPASVLSLLRVSNALGIVEPEKDGKPPVFQPYTGDVHNYSAPWLGVGDSELYWKPSSIGKSVNINGVSWPMELPYVKRFLPESVQTRTLLDHIQNSQSYNFFIFEGRSEGCFNVLRFQGLRKIGFGDLAGDITGGFDMTRFALQKLAAKGQKGVLFTVPYYQDLGIGSWPYPSLSDDEIGAYNAAVKLINKVAYQSADDYDLAVVDLNALYHRIRQGGYKTEQGLAVQGGLEGNFFSSDGIYPSILGQAIIANEVCRAINEKYQAKIPLLDINQYLATIGLPGPQ
ncbi:hypothetical protein ACFQ4C_07665 [Larkinella insperata]|uniref:Uncharacterized protein n=1 Tax=Larkinella insperata TaxID=332158 RepID=A0ABW3QCI0_9BACT